MMEISFYFLQCYMDSLSWWVKVLFVYLSWQQQVIRKANPHANEGKLDVLGVKQFKNKMSVYTEMKYKGKNLLSVHFLNIHSHSSCSSCSMLNNTDMKYS